MNNTNRLFDKKTIKRSFSRAADTYDSSAGVQKEVANELLRFIQNIHIPIPIHGSALHAKECAISGVNAERLKGPIYNVNPEGRRRVLDIGCGTGSLMDAIKSAYPLSTVLGCDIALPMLFKARSKGGSLENLIAADCEALPFGESTFDLVVSSLTYQWVDGMTSSFKEVKRVLRQGGLFIFSTLGPMTLIELRESFKGAAAFMPFHDAHSISEYLEGAGLTAVAIENQRKIKSYDGLRVLLRTLKNIGAAPARKHSGAGLSRGGAIKEAQRVYAERFPSKEGGVIATYDVIYAAALKT